MLQLGAPGLYELPPEPIRSLTGERMDVCAFAGVAPRGPARVPRFAASWLPPPDEDEPPLRRSVPTPVESFDEYRALYGGFEGPGRLPYAVAAYFENGGARALIVRVVHRGPAFAGFAHGTLAGLGTAGGDPVRLWARNEGAWGDRLAVRVTPRARPLPFDEAGSDTFRLLVDRDLALPAGSTLRLSVGATAVLRRVLERRAVQRPDGSFCDEARLDVPLPAAAVAAEVVEATVEVWESAAQPSPGLPVLGWRATAVAVGTLPPDAPLPPVPPGPVTFAGQPRTAAAVTAGSVEDAPVQWLELDAAVSLLTAPAAISTAAGELPVRAVRVAGFEVAGDTPVAPGLALLLDGPRPAARAVAAVTPVLVAGALQRRVVALDAAVDWLPDRADVPAPDDGLSGAGAVERFEQVGLSALHPRWLAKVLLEESALAYPATDWLEADLAVSPALAPSRATPFHGGDDGYPAIVPEDFFGQWMPGEPPVFEGVQCLVTAPEVAALCTPDLYVPEPLPERSSIVDVPTASATFQSCVEPEPMAQADGGGDLPGLALDPVLDLDAVIALQRRLVDFAEQLRAPVALLDVPMRLTPRQVLEWRGAFSSAFAAAYHPWLLVSRADDAREGLLRLTPSAWAAGVIAGRERSVGIPFGPANVLVNGAADLVDRVSPQRHDQLHQHGINLFLGERDGVRLTAARTLSRDGAWRQLSVRRLVTMLARTLERQMQWAVFEPNGLRLRRDVQGMLETFLRGLYQAGAFVGANEREAFFVRCDETLNTPAVVDAGQLIVEVGVAPAQPLEFLVLTISRELNSGVRVEG